MSGRAASATSVENDPIADHSRVVITDAFFIGASLSISRPTATVTDGKGVCRESDHRKGRLPS
jgi:hypothetical protein